MTQPSTDDRAQQLLASEVACWRALSFDDLLPLVGLSGRAVLDETIELAIRVSVRWVDARHQAVRVRVDVEASLPWSMFRVEQAVVVSRPKPASARDDDAMGPVANSVIGKGPTQ